MDVSLALFLFVFIKVSKGAKIRNRYNQVPHLTQDTNKPIARSVFLGKIYMYYFSCSIV